MDSIPTAANNLQDLSEPSFRLVRAVVAERCSEVARLWRVEQLEAQK